jgi:hypothetical protein
MNHQKALYLVALLLIIPSLVCAGGDKDENPTPIPTPTATSAPLDCCPSTEQGIVNQVCGTDPVSLEIVCMGEMADVDLGSDLCKEWVEDANNPGYMTLSITVGGGEDLDVCPDWFDIWPYGLTYINDETVTFSGSLPGSQDLSNRRIFQAMIPEPTSDCYCYTLTASVTDQPPADPNGAHCFVSDGTKSDSIEVCVWRCKDKLASWNGTKSTYLMCENYGVTNFDLSVYSSYSDCNGSVTPIRQWVVINRVKPSGQPTCVLAQSEFTISHRFIVDGEALSSISLTGAACGSSMIPPGSKDYCGSDPGIASKFKCNSAVQSHFVICGLIGIDGCPILNPIDVIIDLPTSPCCGCP